MSTTYKTEPGDTFEIVSRKKYGTEKQARSIQEANPGVREPLISGILITIPELPGRPPAKISKIATGSAEEVALSIDGKHMVFFHAIHVIQSLDSIDTVSFSLPFDPTDATHREIFRPFSFKKARISIGGTDLFSGTLIRVDPDVQPTKVTLSVDCYSTPGVLSDCMPPASAYPLEYIGLTLAGIARQIVAPFDGIKVVFTAAEGPVFPYVALDAGFKVLPFLTGLAKQRNLVISSSPDGELVFSQSVKSGNPTATLREGLPPLIRISSTSKPQDCFSSVTGIEPVLVGLAGQQYTVHNSNLRGVVRPYSYSSPDSVSAAISTAVKSKAGRMFGNMMSYTITLNTWRDPQGALWRPNTTIILTAPSAMIYSAYEFIIRTVEFFQSAQILTAKLKLVLPGSFSGDIPASQPWD